MDKASNLKKSLSYHRFALLIRNTGCITEGFLYGLQSFFFFRKMLSCLKLKND